MKAYKDSNFCENVNNFLSDQNGICLEISGSIDLSDVSKLNSENTEFLKYAIPLKNRLTGLILNVASNNMSSKDKYIEFIVNLSKIGCQIKCLDITILDQLSEVNKEDLMLLNNILAKLNILYIHGYIKKQKELIKQCTQLKELIIFGVDKNVELYDIHLPNLKKLEIKEILYDEDIALIVKCTNLEDLTIAGFEENANVKNLVMNLPDIKRLEITGLVGKKEIDFITRFIIHPKEVIIAGISGSLIFKMVLAFSQLERLEITELVGQKEIDFINCYTNLKELIIVSFEENANIINLALNLPNIKKIEINRIVGQKEIDFITYCTNLRTNLKELIIWNIKEDVDLEDLNNLSKLERLKITGFVGKKEIDFITYCTKLKELIIVGFEANVINLVMNLPNIKRLEITELVGQKEIDFINCYTNLKELIIVGLEENANVINLALNLPKNIKKIEINKIVGQKEIDFITYCTNLSTNLKELIIWNIKEDVDLEVLDLPKLERLEITGLVGQKEIAFINCCTNLTELIIKSIYRDVNNLDLSKLERLEITGLVCQEEIDFINCCTNIKELIIWNIKEVEYVEDSEDEDSEEYLDFEVLKFERLEIIDIISQQAIHFITCCTKLKELIICNIECYVYLKGLDLSTIEKLKITGLVGNREEIAFITCCTKLKELIIWNIEQYVCLEYLNLSTIEKLKVTGLVSQAEIDFINCCTNLEELIIVNIKENVYLEDLALSTIEKLKITELVGQEEIDFINCCTKLEELSISGINSDVGDLNDLDLSKLEKLELENCYSKEIELIKKWYETGNKDIQKKLVIHETSDEKLNDLIEIFNKDINQKPILINGVTSYDPKGKVIKLYNDVNIKDRISSHLIYHVLEKYLKAEQLYKNKENHIEEAYCLGEQGSYKGLLSKDKFIMQLCKKLREVDIDHNLLFLKGCNVDFLTFLNSLGKNVKIYKTNSKNSKKSPIDYYLNKISSISIVHLTEDDIDRIKDLKKTYSNIKGLWIKSKNKDTDAQILSNLNDIGLKLKVEDSVYPTIQNYLNEQHIVEVHDM